MKRIHMKIRTAYYLLCTTAFLYSCSQSIREHYDYNYDIVVTESLWEQIQANDSLTNFAALLEQAGYDKLLNSSQMYTVWAPLDNSYSLDSMHQSAMVREFLNNHVSRAALSVPSSSDSSFKLEVKVLNGKVISFFDDNTRSVVFGNRPLVRSNIKAKNGVLHLIENKANFFDNIWEYLDKDTTLSLLADYYHSFDTTVFDAEASIEGGVVNGQIYYMDSVIYNRNILFSYFGEINNENKQFLFLAPTNEAWNEAYDRIKEYYNYGLIENADQIQDAQTKLSLVMNSVFDLNLNQSLSDSVISTIGTVFRQPDSLFMESEKLTMSNGLIYKTNKLQIKPTESWFKTIVVEAENTFGREGLYCSIENRVASNSTEQVSNGRFVEITPLSTTNPTMILTIPGTLSATYDVYCVFVPEKVLNPNVKMALPTKARFQLSYVNAKGISTSLNLAGVTTDPTKLDTILLRKNFSFPVANFAQDPNVQLKIINNVSNKETALYTRRMLVDCVFFKPVE